MSVPAALAVVLLAIAYFGSNTGVDGTVGALLALVGSVAVLIGSILAMCGAMRGGLVVMLDVLLALATLLTATAVYFLMQYVAAAAMTLALVGLGIAVVSPRRTA